MVWPAAMRVRPVLVPIPFRHSSSRSCNIARERFSWSVTVRKVLVKPMRRSDSFSMSSRLVIGQRRLISVLSAARPAGSSCFSNGVSAILPPPRGDANKGSWPAQDRTWRGASVISATRVQEASASQGSPRAAWVFVPSDLEVHGQVSSGLR